MPRIPQQRALRWCSLSDRLNSGCGGVLVCGCRGGRHPGRSGRHAGGWQPGTGGGAGWDFRATASATWTATTGNRGGRLRRRRRRRLRHAVRVYLHGRAAQAAERVELDDDAVDGSAGWAATVNVVGEGGARGKVSGGRPCDGRAIAIGGSASAALGGVRRGSGGAGCVGASQRNPPVATQRVWSEG